MQPPTPLQLIAVIHFSHFILSLSFIHHPCAHSPSLNLTGSPSPTVNDQPRYHKVVNDPYTWVHFSTFSLCICIRLSLNHQAISITSFPVDQIRRVHDVLPLLDLCRKLILPCLQIREKHPCRKSLFVTHFDNALNFLDRCKWNDTSLT